MNEGWPVTALVLAERLGVEIAGLSLLLLIVTGAALVVWLLLLLAFAVATRPRAVAAGPATMALGEEAPAVANLLTNHCRLTTNAIPATLLDLAARNFVALEEYGSEETICRVRPNPPAGLRAYERMVLEHISSIASNGIVPAEALTMGPKVRPQPG